MKKKTSPKLKFIKSFIPKKKKEKQKIIGIENVLQILKAKRAFVVISIVAVILVSLSMYYPVFLKTKAEIVINKVTAGNLENK
ncbi:MAG TPA: hypothetical protein P5096_00925 [Patescibacteria group bacterium]|nr:hypothetical protein [Patescibacteria group bacterium]